MSQPCTAIAAGSPESGTTMSMQSKNRLLTTSLALGVSQTVSAGVGGYGVGGRTAGMKSRPMQWADAADSLTERSCGSAAPSVIASVVRSARR